MRTLAHLLRPTLLAAIVLALPALPARVLAVTRACGADAVANVANVLCAPPSGPCTATDVTMSANIEIPVGGCDLDLGGRSLRIERTLQMMGENTFYVTNAASITITPTGKLKARADYLRPSNAYAFGGDVILESRGSITHQGLIDVSGVGAGFVGLSAVDDVTLESGSTIAARGTSSIVDDGGPIGDGGNLEISTAVGSLAVRGDVLLPGTTRGAGGIIYFEIAGDATIERTIDASGGAYDGGDIEMEVGRKLLIRATLSVDSRSGGGSGGRMGLYGGLAEGGSGGVTIDGAVLQLSGSSSDEFGGDGGELDIGADGPIRVQGARAAIRANANGRFAGESGLVTIFAGNSAAGRDGDITIDSPIFASSDGMEGTGGSVLLDAEDDITVRAAVSSTGKLYGGFMAVFAGGDATFAAPIDLSGKSAVARPGYLTARAGQGRVGTLAIEADVRILGGSQEFGRGVVDLASCALRVAPGVRIDGSGGTSTGFLGGSVIRMAARQPMLLGAGSRYLGRPGGSVETVHPPGQDPVIGAGVVFDPLRVDRVSTNDSDYPACPTAP